MKKLLLLMCCLLTTFAVHAKDFKNYSFKITDPYKSTYMGSYSAEIGNDIKVRRKEYTLPPLEKVDKLFWYEKKTKFTLSRQKESAPLIFIIPGTGATSTSSKVRELEKLFYGAGYHVISLSSALSPNFIVTASTTHVPGFPYEDSQDLYEVMKKAYEKVEKKIEVENFNLVGYSMGGTHAAFVSYIDSKEKHFNFDKVLMINPAVNLLESSAKIDSLLDNNLRSGRGSISQEVDRRVEEVVAPEIFQKDYFLDAKNIYSAVHPEKLSDQEMAFIIGAVFRVVAMNTNYISDYLSGQHLYVPADQKRFDSEKEIWEKLKDKNFSDYITKIAFPYYKKQNPSLTYDDVLKRVDLSYIEEYVRTADNVAVVTNRDELILSDKDISYIENTFGDRALFYPTGGHCGNMLYDTNVKVMLNYFEEGVLLNEL